jgi:amino acid adenylation domain-containing protein
MEPKEYWRQKFSGEWPGSTFPPDRTGELGNGYRLERFDSNFPADVFSRLLEISNDSDLRLYIFLVTALSILVHKYTGQEDVVLGAPIYRQPSKENFINTVLAFRLPVNTDRPFKGLLLAVGQEIYAANEHQNHPIENLFYRLQPVKGGPDFPLFRTAVLLENIHQPGYVADLLLDMVFAFYRQAETIGGQIRYNGRLYSRGMVERLAAHLRRLLGAVIFDLDIPVGKIEILSPGERQQLLQQLNDTEAAYCQAVTLPALFEAQVDRGGDRTALVEGKIGEGSRHLSYGDLNGRANRLARYLKSRQVKPGEIVGVLLERSLEMIVGILGVLKAGGAYLPIDPGYPASRIRFMLADSQAGLLIAANWKGAGRETCREIVDPRDPAVYRGEGENVKHTHDPSHPVYVIYTSGTSGRPRGVMAEHRNVIGYLNAFAHEFLIGEGDVVVQQFSLAFDACVEEIYPPLLAGGRLAIPHEAEVKDIDWLRAFMVKHSVTIVSCTPLMLDRLNQAGEMRGVRLYISGGDVLKAAYISNILSRGAVYNTYGPTEATVCACYYRCTTADPPDIPIGSPIANYRVYVLGKAELLLPAGMVGELCIAGPGVVRGYLNDPDGTAQKFTANPFSRGERLYRTGDLGRLLPDGNIAFKGRSDRQVKIRGYRIELSEIENQLLRHRDIMAAVVINRRDGADSYLCGYLVPRWPPSLELPGVKKYLARQLPAYMIPAHFVILEKLPTTPNRKVDLDALPAPDPGQRSLTFISESRLRQLEEKMAYGPLINRAPQHTAATGAARPADVRLDCCLIGETSLCVECARILLDSGHHLRGIISADPAVTRWAGKNNIPSITGGKSRIIAFLKQHPFDYLFSIFNMYILPPEIIALARKEVFNYHDSLLPRYAGLFAPSWAIMNGERRHGITWHRLDTGVDTGDIVKQVPIDVEEKETSFSLHLKCYEAAVLTFGELLADLLAGRETSRRQNLEERTYYGRYRRPADGGVLSFNEEAEKIDARARALNFGHFENPLGTFKLVVEGNFFVIPGIEVLTVESRLPPGTVVYIGDRCLRVATSTRDVEIRDILRWDGEGVAVTDFVQQFNLKEGDRLTPPDNPVRERLARYVSVTARHEAFWVERLDRLAPLVVLPTNWRDRDAVTPGYSSRRFSLPKELAEEQNETARIPILISAFAAYLAALAGPTSFDLGYSDYVLQQRISETVGLFAPSLPLHIESAPARPFEDFCRDVADELGRIRQRETYMRDVFVRYPALKSPVKKTLPIGISLLPQLEDSRQPMFDSLEMVIAQTGDECLFRADSQLLDDENMGRLLHHFSLFLTGVRANPAATVPPDLTGTGDIGFIKKGCGRVKKNGSWVELAGIEDCLSRLDAVKEAAVVAAAAGDRGDGEPEWCAYLVSDTMLQASEIRDELSGTLPVDLMPSAFVQLGKMPLTGSGKINRKLLESAAQEIGVDPGYRAPTNEMERRLVGLWSEILKVDQARIGIDGNFFDLGGHSLKAVTLSSVIHREFAVKMPVAEIFKRQTVKGLCEYLRGVERESYSPINPVEKRQFYPLSSAQKRLYILQQLETVSTSYNTPLATWLEGNLEIQKLRRCLDHLVRRHESFRTSFRLVGEEAVQIVHGALDVEIEYYDLTPAERTDSIIENFIRPFDLSRAPLLRVGLARYSTTQEGKYVLMVDMHHIITDGTSMGIFLREFMDMYGGRGLPPLRLQYKDYAGWHDRLKEGDDIRQQKEYWLKEFEREVPVLNLPTDYPRPEIQSFEGGHSDFSLEDRAVQGLKAVGRQEGATLFMVFLAVLNVFLSRLGGQEEIVIGTPTAGRRHADLQAIIGMFVNTLVLRNYPGKDLTFPEFLRQVKEKTLLAFDNQDYQFEDLVERVSLNRDASRNPLFDVMAVEQNMDIPEIKMPGLRLRPYGSKIKTAKFDLFFFMVDGGDKLYFTVEYCSRLFRERTIVRFIRYIRAIVKAVIENPDQKISEIKITCESEREQILNEFNRTEADYPRDKTVHELFEARVKGGPDAVAALFGVDQRLPNLQVTYRVLNGCANRLARFLLAHGVSGGQPVAILCPRSIDMLIAILGVLKAGGAYIPIDIRYPAHRVRSMLAECGSEVVITKSGTAEAPGNNREELYRLCIHGGVSHIVYLDNPQDILGENEIFRTLSFCRWLSGKSSLPSEEEVDFWRQRDFRFGNRGLAYDVLMTGVRRLIGLIEQEGIAELSPRGIMLENPIYKIMTLLSLKARHLDYEVLDAALEGPLGMAAGRGIKVLFSESRFLDEADRSMWESGEPEVLVLIDSYRPEKDVREKRVKAMWDYIAEKSSDAANDYGWVSRFTRKNFSMAEMQEYVEDIKIKLTPHLTKDSRVLELGCGHGIVMDAIAPQVAYYMGVDISEAAIARNRQRLERQQFGHVELRTLSASHISSVKDRTFDVIIAASVIQYFPNTLYLEHVIKGALELLADRGIIFLADVPDLRKKAEWIEALMEQADGAAGFRQERGWQDELHVDIGFFTGLQHEYPEITGVEKSSKRGRIENELTRFRYDVLLQVDKSGPRPGREERQMRKIYTGLDIEKIPAREFGDRDRDRPDFQGQENDPVPAWIPGRVVAGDTVARYEERNPAAAVGSTDLCYIIFTSGSTGRPKGVMIEHRSVVNFIRAMTAKIEFLPAKTIMALTTISFDIFVLETLLPLLCGMRVVVAGEEEQRDPELLSSAVVKYGIGMLQVTPSRLRLLLNDRQNLDCLQRLEELMVGGEAFPPQVLAELKDHFSGRLYNLYGPAETTVWSTLKDLTGRERVDIGRPIANTQVYIVDNRADLVPVGVAGELCIGGDGLARGYLNHPELTVDKFMNLAAKIREETRSPKNQPLNPKSQILYRTGDLSRWLPDGSIEFLGRLDQQVKIRGFRIELAEIESHLNALAAVQGAVVIDRTDDDGDRYLCAYLVDRPDTSSPEVSALRRYLSRELPDYMIPAYFVRLPQLPLTPNGKLDRRALPDPRAGYRVRQPDPRRISALLNRGQESEDELKTGLLRPDTPTLERLVAYFSLRLQEAFFDDRLQISGVDVCVLSEQKRRQWLFDLPRPAADGPAEKTLVESFEEQSDRTPDHIALSAGRDSFISYRSLNEKANQLTRLLRAKGVKPDAVVGIMAGPSMAMVLGILGILKAGGAYLSLDSHTPVERAMERLAHHRVSVVLAASETALACSYTMLTGFRGKGTMPVVTPPRSRITDLDDLPMPDRSLVDYEKYNRYIGQALVKNCISLLASRGCPYRCAYCHKIWPSSQVSRSAENILAEIGVYYDLGIRRFAFVDDTFNVNIDNSRRFFELIRRAGLDLRLFFPNGLRGDVLTRDYIDTMINAGTTGIVLALETACPRLQKLIRKNLHLERFRENCEYLCKQYPQVILELFTMHGFPSETEAEALQTLDFIKSLKWLHFPYVNILRIYSHTDMEKLALAHGISAEAIERSMNRGFHELTDTLPFPKSFTLKYQADFFNEYFLSGERLRHVLPYQMAVLSEDEIVQKYNSYLPVDIASLDDFLRFAGMDREALQVTGCLDESGLRVPALNEGIRNHFPAEEPADNALRVLLLDLSQFFSSRGKMLYDVVEPPLGLMAVMTYLRREFGTGINGKVAKSRIDFDHYRELKALLEEFKPDVIGIRTLTFYRDFFHVTTAMIRQWGVEVPIVAGGPYATSDYETILQDKHVDLVVLGEGERTFAQVIGCIREHGGKLPPPARLREIRGIALRGQERAVEGKSGREPRDVIFLDEPAEPWAGESTANPDHLNRPTDLACVDIRRGLEQAERDLKLTHRHINHFILRAREAGGERDGEWAVSCVLEASAGQIFSALLQGGSLLAVGDSAAFRHLGLLEFYRTSEAGQPDRPSFQVFLLLEGVDGRLGIPAAGGAGGTTADEIEERMAAIWAEVLGVDPRVPGVDANFFELGGHSLKATVLIEKIHREFDRKIALAEVFRTPTIEGLSALIRKAGEKPFTPIPVVEKKEYYTASSAQKRLYIQQRMKRDSMSYNLPSAALLEGQLDRVRLEGCLAGLVRRHGVLRTSFGIVKEELVQKIDDTIDLGLEYFPLPTDSEAAVPGIRQIISNFVRPFDLSHPPLLRLGMIHTGAGRNILMLDVHHIIVDGISKQIFIKELTMLYGGRELPPLRIQYKDYSEWQRRQAQQESLRRQELYWLKEFSGPIPVLKLPASCRSPKQRGGGGERVSFWLDRERTEALKALARESEVTLFMLLLGILNILLCRVCGQQDIVVGTPTAGRRHSDLAPLMGMFVNTLALRNYPAAGKTFADFIREVKTRTLAAFDNQDYQFDRLVERVSLTGDPQRRTLFDVMFAFQNIETVPTRLPEMQVPGLRVKPYGYAHRVAPFDLCLLADESGDRLLFSFLYAADIFDKETAERLAGYFEEIVDAVVADNRVALKDIKISHQLFGDKLHIPADATADFGF